MGRAGSMLSVRTIFCCCDAWRKGFCHESLCGFTLTDLFLLFILVSIIQNTVGLTASCFGLGATLSNFLGQMVVEQFGHVASLAGSLFLSVVPLLLFTFMPETLGHRGDRISSILEQQSQEYKSMGP